MPEGIFDSEDIDAGDSDQEDVSDFDFFDSELGGGLGENWILVDEGVRWAKEGVSGAFGDGEAIALVLDAELFVVRVVVVLLIVQNINLPILSETVLPHALNQIIVLLFQPVLILLRLPDVHQVLRGIVFH